MAKYKIIKFQAPDQPEPWYHVYRRNWLMWNRMKTFISYADAYDFVRNEAEKVRLSKQKSGPVLQVVRFDKYGIPIWR